jgi:N-acetyl-anhydromuramyl-L-alanine amidase AmpD
MSIVPASWMPNCSMKRIILHWTAGAHRASSLDLAHYHILIEDDGKLVRGTHSIKDNVSTADNVYAAHTLRLNTGSIGVSVCCMAGAVESPFNPGSFPMTQTQWETMSQVVAELCQVYDISVTPDTVLGHGEVTKNLGINQRGKWDPMVLPWDTSLSKKQVGDIFRQKVKDKMSGRSNQPETPASITAIIQGKTFREAQIFNEKSLIKIRPVVEEFGWMILHANQTIIELNVLSAGDPQTIPYKLIDQTNDIVDIPANSTEAEIVDLVQRHGFFSAVDLAQIINLSVIWDGTTRTVIIG